MPKDKKADEKGAQEPIYEEMRTGVSDREVAEILDKLRKKGEKLALAESLTAGMITARFADIPGSSDVLDRAYITYSNTAKHQMVKVRKSTLEEHGAVSRQTAKQMAEGGARKAGAAACISATGYAGPASDKKDGSVGHVFLGCCYKGKTTVEEHWYAGKRNEIRVQAMNDAIRLLASALK